MLAGGFREEGSGVPSGVAEAVERLRPNQEGSNTRAPGPEGGLLGDQSAEEAGVLLELEDIARERCGAVRCCPVIPLGAESAVGTKQWLAVVSRAAF